MDASAWLSSLQPCSSGETNEAEAEGGEPAREDAKQVNGSGAEPRAAEDVNQPQPRGEGGAAGEEARAADELECMGFPRHAVVAALAASGGDFEDALGFLTSEAARRKAANRKRALSPGKEADVDGALEVEGVQCAVTPAGELVLRLPHSPADVGPVVGRCAPDGTGITFGGMDDWLWELYESHPCRPMGLPPSFDVEAVATALNNGEAYVWDGFATEGEIRSANAALEEMFARRELSRGSSSWVDECAEGGHARGRRTLEGQRRQDACGFWNLFGDEPAPPAPVLALFRRLEAAGAQLRAVHGWPVLVSQLGMGAVYDGRGAFYSQHRDNEWQRHLQTRTPKPHGARPRRPRVDEPAGAWMNFRELTMLAYVNLPGHFGEDEEGRKAGGRLRCYSATKRGDLDGRTARELRDVAPLGGRAVIFRSRELLHEVLPSFARRYALTLWFCAPP